MAGMTYCEDTSIKAEKLGIQFEKKCTGCAQSTLAAVLDTLNIQSEDVFKAASGLADGIGLSGDGACGALTGGVLVIGLLFGRDRAHFEDPLAASDSYLLANELHRHFIEAYGSCRCHDIQKKLMGRAYNLMDQGDLFAAMEDGMIEHCSKVVGAGAAKTVDIIRAHLSIKDAGKSDKGAISCAIA